MPALMTGPGAVTSTSSVAVRAATVALFRNLPAEAWTRRGVASGNPFTVRALAYIAAGHVAHHMRILREQYL